MVKPTDKQLLERAARIAHEVNRAYCAFHGDETHGPWDFAPREAQESLKQGITRLWLEDLSPRKMHEDWMAVKLADGWTHGETKDWLKKTHPCLVPHDELPDFERCKDHLLIAIAKAVIADDRMNPAFDEEEVRDNFSEGLVGEWQAKLARNQQAQLEFEKHQALLDFYARALPIESFPKEFLDSIEQQLRRYFLPGGE